jgi:hypothetical protein
MRRNLITTAAVAALFLGSTALPIARTRAATEKIKGIVTVAHGKLEALRSQGGTVDKTKARAIVKTAFEQITGSLTTAQKTKFKELMKTEKA